MEARINWRKLLLPFVALYVVAWIGACWWIAQDTRKNDWLVERHLDPHTAPVPSLLKGDWCAILAQEDFASLSVRARLLVADRIFDAVEHLAVEQGWDSGALREWFYKTAQNYDAYPVVNFLGSGGRTIPYRELRESQFPRPNTSKLLLKLALSKDLLLCGIIASPFLFISYVLVVGTVGAFRTKGLAPRWKLLIGALVGVGVLAGVAVQRIASRPIELGFYHFFDMEDYVAVEGSWASDTPLAAPLQATKLECWRAWGQCIEATASVYGGTGLLATRNLGLETTYWEVARWGGRKIVAKEKVAACTSTSLEIDRENEIVTSTRITRKPKPSDCAHVSDDPIFLHLSDGLDLRFRE